MSFVPDTIDHLVKSLVNDRELTVTYVIDRKQARRDVEEFMDQGRSVCGNAGRCTVLDLSYGFPSASTVHTQAVVIRSPGQYSQKVLDELQAIATFDRGRGPIIVMGY